MEIKLTEFQKKNLEILRVTFGDNWFIEEQWIELDRLIPRFRFVLETLVKKGALIREMNPERGKRLDDFYRYKIK